MTAPLLCCLAALTMGQDATPVWWKTLSEIKPDWWSVKAKYPVLAKHWPLGDLAGSVVARKESAAWSEFLQSARQEMPDVKKSGAAGTYEYDATTTVKMNDKRLLSFTTDCYVYTAGAHGIGFTKTYVFGLVEGKPKQLRVWDILRSGESDKRDLQFQLLGKAKDEETAEWVQDGEVTEFDERQLENFWIAKDGIRWEFAPYELGPYVSGPFTLKLTWKELGPLVRRNGPAGFLVKE